MFFDSSGLQFRGAFLPSLAVMLKALKPKDYPEEPSTLGEHLKRRRWQLDLVRRDAAKLCGCCPETHRNWGKGKTRSVAPQFRPLIAFLGYGPYPGPLTLAERIDAKRRQFGVTFFQVARYLGWDEGTLTRYLSGTWRIPVERAAALETFFAGPFLAPAQVESLPRRLWRRARERKAR